MFFIHLIWLPEFSLKNELLLKYVFNIPAIYLNTDKKYKFNFFFLWESNILYDGCSWLQKKDERKMMNLYNQINIFINARIIIYIGKMVVGALLKSLDGPVVPIAENI